MTRTPKRTGIILHGKITTIEKLTKSLVYPPLYFLLIVTRNILPLYL